MGNGAQHSSPHPADGWHFLLLAGGTEALADPDALTAQLRRMGVQPEILPTMPGALQANADPPAWRVRLGALTVQLAIARAGSPVMASAMAAPGYPVAGQAPALLVTPEVPASAAARAGQSRELFKLACLLADAVTAQHVYWSPAQLWSAVPDFRRAVAEMLTSGMPPVLHIVAFAEGPGGQVATRGLAFYCGQELVVDSSGGLSRPEQLRRLARLAIDMMTNGPIRAARRFPGLNSGEEIAVLLPEADDAGGALRIRFERQ